MSALINLGKIGNKLALRLLRYGRHNPILEGRFIKALIQMLEQKPVAHEMDHLTAALKNTCNIDLRMKGFKL